jgi:hypothetical protein
MLNTTTVINPCKGCVDHINIGYPNALQPKSETETGSVESSGQGTVKSSVEGSEKGAEKSSEKILTLLQATSDMTSKEAQVQKAAN